MFTRVKPLGYAFGEILPSADVTTLDDDHHHSVDEQTLSIGSRAITRVSPFPGIPGIRTNWSNVDQPIAPETNVNTAQELWFPLRLPHGVTITTISVDVNPPNGHGGFPIGNMPQIFLEWYSATSTSPVNVGSFTDNSGSQVVYEAQHALTIGGLSHIIDNAGRRYFLRLVTESGANAASGFKAFVPIYTYTLAALDPD